MAIPKSPPRRYSSSRQLIAGDDVNNLSDRICSFQSFAALGANAQATATPIDAANVEIAAGVAAGAVKLPVSYPGAEVSILNNSGNTQNVYPQIGDNIQNASNGYVGVNAAVTQVTLTSYIYTCIKIGFWQRTPFGGV